MKDRFCYFIQIFFKLLFVNIVNKELNSIITLLTNFDTNC